MGREGPDLEQGSPGRFVALGQKQGDDPGKSHHDEHHPHPDGMLFIGLPSGEDRTHIQADEDHQPRRRPGIGMPFLPDGEGTGGRGETPVHLEGIGALFVGHLAPLGGLDGDETGQIEVGAVEVADPVRVAVGQDYPGGVGDDEVIDARLLCRFYEEFLEPEGVPAQAGAGACPGLEGADQGVALFQQQAVGFRFLPVQALHGHEDEQGHQHQRCPDDEPWGDDGPGPALF